MFMYGTGDDLYKPPTSIEVTIHLACDIASIFSIN